MNKHTIERDLIFSTNKQTKNAAWIKKIEFECSMSGKYAICERNLHPCSMIACFIATIGQICIQIIC